MSVEPVPISVRSRLSRVFNNLDSFSTKLMLRYGCDQSIFISGRKEVRKPIEISTVEFVVQQNGTA